MPDDKSYQIYSLGDAAVTIDLGNVIDQKLNQKALMMQRLLEKQLIPGVCEIVAAYSSVTILYDAFLISQKNKFTSTVFEFISSKLEWAYQRAKLNEASPDKKLISVPVCYGDEFGQDIEWISKTTGLSIQEIVSIHTSQVFYVFMIGFIPGFAYMGEVDQRIQVPRKEKPEMVSAGSVGIAGAQTGIYPLDSPGGWRIMGRTPIKLFDKDAESPARFSPGQLVQFHEITRKEFEKWQSPS